MADENRHVRVIDVFIHDDVVTVIRVAEIDKVVVIFAVVAGDLAGIIELVKQFVAQNGLHLRHAGARVQTVGEQQQNILLFHARRVQLVDARADRDLAVAGRLVAALDDIRDDNDDGAALMRQLGKRLHTNRVANALERFRIERIPVLRQAFGVGHSLARHEDIGVVRQIGAHQALPIFKIKLHLSSPLRRVERKRWGFAPNPTRELSSLDLPPIALRHAARQRMGFVRIDIPRPLCGIQRDINRPQAGLGGSPAYPQTSPLTCPDTGE